MLLFIQLPSTLSDSSSVISIHLMLLFIADHKDSAIDFSNFNTSHVTVYPNIETEETDIWKFQYISCYCLSVQWRIGRIKFRISIHLMLLFILSERNQLQPQHYFNTSHVTVYQESRTRSKKSSRISIHLMLLFIVTLLSGSSNTAIISIHLMLLFIVLHSL